MTQDAYRAQVNARAKQIIDYKAEQGGGRALGCPCFISQRSTS